MVTVGAVGVLLDKLKLAFSRESQADIAELLFLTIESIVQEANLTKSRTSLSPSSPSLLIDVLVHHFAPYLHPPIDEKQEEEVLGMDRKTNNQIP